MVSCGLRRNSCGFIQVGDLYMILKFVPWHSVEPTWIVVLRTILSVLAIVALLVYAIDLAIQIKTERFSTRDHTAVEPFDNVTKFGMVQMPSVLVFTNILSMPSFENSPYFSVNVSVGCWDPAAGLGSSCPCTVVWYQSVVQNTQDQLQWNPSYRCDVCSCQAPLRTDAVWVEISLNPAWTGEQGVYDNTQLILYDPNSQAFENIGSFLNTTGEPNERAFLTPFSLYYNFGALLRYTVAYSRRSLLKRTWRDIVGLSGLHQSVNLYTIDPIPQNGYPSASQYEMTAVLYPGWGISPGGQGFVVTEEFRSRTIPALLASIGGIWTILDIIFMMLFGRTLLFPIFGTKPISPFGLIGRFNGSLKRRLRDKYGELPVQVDDQALGQFIRDFVIDPSPLAFGVSPPRQFSQQYQYDDRK